jgi:DNA-binding NarL/FixJ family response regulator
MDHGHSPPSFTLPESFVFLRDRRRLMESVNELTNQERRVLALVARGWRNAKIARELVVSTRTVENHLYHVFDKLGVSSRTEAALCALSSDLLTPAKLSRNTQDLRENAGYTHNVG